MPVRGIIFPTERHWFGFLERLYVHCNLRTITEIAKRRIIGARDRRRIEQARQHDDKRRRLGRATVICVIRRDKMIRLEDAIRRAESLL